MGGFCRDLGGLRGGFCRDNGRFLPYGFYTYAHTLLTQWEL